MHENGSGSVEYQILFAQRLTILFNQQNKIVHTSENFNVLDESRWEPRTSHEKTWEHWKNPTKSQ